MITDGIKKGAYKKAPFFSYIISLLSLVLINMKIEFPL
jgi:hypothetical protein